MKPWYMSRTMWVQALIAVLGAVELYGQGLSALIGPKWLGATLLAVGVVNAVMRAITSEGIRAS